MQHILYTPKTSVRTVRPSPRNCPTLDTTVGTGEVIQAMPSDCQTTGDPLDDECNYQLLGRREH